MSVGEHTFLRIVCKRVLLKKKIATVRQYTTVMFGRRRHACDSRPYETSLASSQDTSRWIQPSDRILSTSRKPVLNCRCRSVTPRKLLRETGKCTKAVAVDYFLGCIAYIKYTRPIATHIARSRFGCSSLWALYRNGRTDRLWPRNDVIDVGAFVPSGEYGNGDASCRDHQYSNFFVLFLCSIFTRKSPPRISPRANRRRRHRPPPSALDPWPLDKSYRYASWVHGVASPRIEDG